MNQMRYELNQENINTCVPKSPKVPGVYKIFINFVIPRIKGETDLVYIGVTTKDLHDRLSTFPKGFKFCDKYPDRPYKIYSKRHAVRRFWKLLKEEELKLTFKFEVTICGSGKEAKELETAEILRYEDKHLELPALNHKN